MKTLWLFLTSFFSYVQPMAVATENNIAPAGAYYHHCCVDRIKDIIFELVKKKQEAKRLACIHQSQEILIEKKTSISQGVLLYVGVFHELHSCIVPFKIMPICQPAMIYPDDIKAWQEIMVELKRRLRLSVYQEEREVIDGVEYVRTWYAVEAIDDDPLAPVVARLSSPPKH